MLYFLLVARTYHAGEMGQTYPLMRGIAPLIVAFAGVLFLGEPLSEGGAAGIFLICFGVLGMALGSRREQARSIAYAVTNAVVVAAYTLIDGFGARLSNAPATYTLWVFLLTGLPLGLWLTTTGRSRVARLERAMLWRPLLGGAATSLSYSLILGDDTGIHSGGGGAAGDCHFVRRGHFRRGPQGKYAAHTDGGRLHDSGWCGGYPDQIVRYLRGGSGT